MNKVTKYTLLFLLLIPYIAVSIFDMLFGILQMPFSWAEKKIIKKANDINIK
jgi:hypothetical protein